MSYAFGTVAADGQQHGLERRIGLFDALVHVTLQQLYLFHHPHEFHHEDFPLLLQQVVAFRTDSKLLLYGEKIGFGGRDIQLCHRLCVLTGKVLVDELVLDTVQLVAGQDAQQAPAQIKRLLDGAVFVLTLRKEFRLKFAAEFEVELVKVGKFP